MVRSLYSGVSGLKAHQTRMDVIGNNIANVNTYGFKASRTCFKDIYYQAARTETGGNATFAGNNSSQVGYGVEVASIDKDMSISNFQNTNRTLDLAIDDDGFFICGTVDRLGNINSVTYTRMGNFGIDSAGNFVNSLNQFVLGTKNKSRLDGGAFSSNELNDVYPATEPNELDQINVDDLVWDAFKPDLELDFDSVAAKLKSPESATKYGDDNTPLLTVFSGTDPYDDRRSIAYDYHMARNFAAGTGTPPYAEFNAAQPINIGTERPEETLFANEDGTPRVDMENGIYETDADLINEVNDPASELIARPYDTTARYDVISDYILYNVNGQYVNNQGIVYDEKVGLYQDKDGNYYEYTCKTGINEDGTLTKYHTYTLMTPTEDLTADPQITYSPSNQVFTYNDVNKTFERQDERGNTIYADMDDGSLKYDDLDSMTVGANGIVTAGYGSALYSLFRIELASFENVEGLNEIGNTHFAETTASGEAKIKRPGENGVGNIASKKLEMSNVNLADEFSDMVVTQRGYQANARIITTSDSMLEELVNLKR